MTCRARALGADAAAMCRSGTGKLAADGAGSKARPSEPHQVQWPWLEVSCASPCAGLDAALNARPLLLSKLQTPPSLPLRMSIDSAAAGAPSADSTAKKLSQTARRAHSGRAKEREKWVRDTVQIIGSAPSGSSAPGVREEQLLAVDLVAGNHVLPGS